MTRAEIVAAMRQLGHLRVLANGYEAGLLDEEYVLATIEIEVWKFRSQDWRDQVLPILRALRERTEAAVR